MKTQSDKLLMERSGGNVFADLGFSQTEAANLALRSECMIAIERWYAASGLTQATAAAQLGITQPRLNALLKGAIDKFSLDALVNLCARAGLRAQLRLTVPRKRAA